MIVSSNGTWQLPENTFIIYDKHPDGYYQMSQGSTLIFEFKIPPGGEVKIDILMTKPDTQDLSIRGYFSQFPSGQSINLTDPNLRWFSFPRIQRTIVLKDVLFVKPGFNPNYAYPAGTYYINVQNLVNMYNSFRLQFHELSWDDLNIYYQH